MERELNDGKNMLQVGLYEHLVDDELRATVRHLEPELSADIAEVDDADYPDLAAHHIAARVKAALLQARAEDRVKLANVILGSIPDPELSSRLDPDRKLMVGIREKAPLPRPSTPLTQTALLTNAAGTPSLNSELRLEMGSADRVDLLCAFVKWSGITVLERALADLRDRRVPIRVLTTTYIGATERRALDRLVTEYGANVRVNFDSRTTHLHAKAWLFYRRSGFDTGYVGSSNLSRTALVDGLEWNVRVSREANPVLMDNFAATFESYWNSNVFEAYVPNRDGDRLSEALLKASTGRSATTARDAVAGVSTHFLDVRPYPHQVEMLDDLAVERAEHRRSRNLLVAATGTGKTVIAALDYQRLLQESRERAREEGRAQRPLRLLFVAHRREILEQALGTYRAVLKSGTFGALLLGGSGPTDSDHVFASIQSMAREAQLGQWSRDHFDVLVIDEFHHSEAATYRKILQWFLPEQLLGLTATPERADGVDVSREFFDGRIASELRLWDALEADLLVPFHYFGIADNVDLTRVAFRGGSYDQSELSRLYTGNERRAALIIEAVAEKVLDVQVMRALGFCVTVAHAQFMAKMFNEAGIASVALSGESTGDERDDALDALRRGALNCIFTVDLFNEGVDVPEVDAVLMLRPTQSSTIFIQQLGRGLRRSEGKAVLTVLDFVGMQHAKFRFDIKLRAMTGIPRGHLEKSVKAGFPYVPGGSQIVLDRVAEERILKSIKSQLFLSTKELVADVRQHLPHGVSSAEFGLSDYLSRAGRALPDIYSVSSGNRTSQGKSYPATWSAIHHWAFGAKDDTVAERELEKTIMRRLINLTHVDDAQRSRAYGDIVQSSKPSTDLVASPYAAMLYYSFWPVGRGEAMAEGLDEIRSNSRLCRELSELSRYSLSTARTAPRPLPGALAGSPLLSHARYSREELFAALGLGVAEKSAPGTVREGVKWVAEYNTDVLLVTLQKSEADFSPTTRYRDYALSPTLFHWESQSGISGTSPTGQRYVDHERRGSQVLLFVRHAKTGELKTEPYVCLGTARYVSHQGAKPMQIVWELDRAMPAEVYMAAKAVA
jgi:superfamily II DNA or RNA helicase/HKD family nuclease